MAGKNDRHIDGLLTVRQAARFLGRSPSWLFQALRRDPEEEGSIPHVRLPGRRGGVRFDRVELLEWLHAGAPPAGVWASMRTARKTRRVLNVGGQSPL